MNGLPIARGVVFNFSPTTLAHDGSKAVPCDLSTLPVTTPALVAAGISLKGRNFHLEKKFAATFLSAYRRPATSEHIRTAASISELET
jgi:hypothetical protein